MLVLALILLLLVAVVVVSAVLAGDGEATLNLVGADITTTERTLFLAGVVSTAVAGLALWMLVKGTQRARRKRSEMRHLRDAAARSETPRRSENSERDDRGSVRSPEPEPGPGRDTGRTTRHRSTGPGRGVRSPTDPGDDERDHFETLPRE